MNLTKTLLVILGLSLIQVARSDAKDDAVSAARACYGGFIANIPATFCYKQGGDVGTIPTACSAGYFRSAALCYQNCNSGYEFVLGVCWQRSCPSGYKDLGATCFKSLVPFNWPTKGSYIPSSYTNFDGRAACDAGKYKSGALCYRDCSAINAAYSNCGIGACASSTAACVSTIVTMAADVAISLAQTVTFVASFGSDAEVSGAAGSAAKAGMEKGIGQLGKDAVKSAAAAAKNMITKEGLTKFIEKMTEDALKSVGSTVALGVVTTACQSVGNSMFNKLGVATSDVSINLQNFDPTGISSVVSNCKAGQVNTEAQKVACAQAVLSAVSFADPTGLIGLATAVMQPTC